MVTSSFGAFIVGDRWFFLVFVLFGYLSAWFAFHKFPLLVVFNRTRFPAALLSLDGIFFFCSLYIVRLL